MAKQADCKGMTPWQCRALVRDAVLASFSLQSGGKRLPARMETKKVFDAFCQLQAKSKYERWLGSLHFEKQANSCISKQLEDVLFNLGAFGLVTVENHDYRYLRIATGARSEFKKQVKSRLEPEDVKVLQDLSNEFAGLVNP